VFARSYRNFPITVAAVREACVLSRLRFADRRYSFCIEAHGLFIRSPYFIRLSCLERIAFQLSTEDWMLDELVQRQPIDKHNAMRDWQRDASVDVRITNDPFGILSLRDAVEFLEQAFPQHENPAITLTKMLF